MRRFILGTLAAWLLGSVPVSAQQADPASGKAGPDATDTAIRITARGGQDARLPAGAAPGTISLWFARPAGVSDKVLFVYGGGAPGRARGLWLVRNDQLCFYFMSWPDDLHVKVPGGIAANRWHQVVATYDGATARLYYDGQMLGSVATTATSRAWSKTPRCWAGP